MAQYTVDWTTQDYLPWGWTVTNQSNFTLGEDGLGLKSASLNRNFANQPLTNDIIYGTMNMKFNINTIDGSTLHSLMVSPFYGTWDDGAGDIYRSWIPYYLYTQIYNGTNLKFMLRFNGDEVLDVAGLTTGSTGTLVSYFGGTSGTDITYTMILTYGGSTLGSVFYDNFNTASFSISGVGDIPNTQVSGSAWWTGGETPLYLTSGTFLCEAVELVPVNDPCLDYYGYYNNGSSEGLRDLSANVLSITPVQQILKLPGHTGGFFPEVTVKLKNNSNQWGTFTGFAVSGTPYNPAGAFRIRDKYINGGNEYMFYGLADYDNMVFDSLNKTVEIKLKSLGNLWVDKPLLDLTFFSMVEQQSVSGQILRIFRLGTVLSASGNIGELGTVTLFHNNIIVEQAMEGNWICAYGNSDMAQIINNEGGTTDSGTFFGTYTMNIPDWLSVGQIINANLSTMQTNVSIPLWQFAVDTLNASSALYFNRLYNELYIPFPWFIAYTFYYSDLTTSPTIKIQGNEKLMDVLQDIINSYAGFAHCSTNVMNVFVPTLDFLLQEPENTLDYEEDLYQDFTYTTSPKVREITYDYNYNDDTKKFESFLSVVINEAQTDGETMNLKSKIIGRTEDALAAAYIIGLFYDSNIILNIVTKPTNWNTLQLGKTVSITNIPTEFAILTDTFLTISRTFDPQTKMVRAQLMGLPPLEEDFFRVGVDYIGGDVEVL